MATRFFAAVDPMSMILSGKAYLIWVEKNHPHVPKVAEIQEVLPAMTAVERRATIARAQELAAYGQAFAEATAAR